MSLGKLGQALTAREIFDLIHDDLVAVERRISAESVASVDAVTAIGQYLQSSGGKRLRPALLLISAKLAGRTTASAIHLGAVVEMIHAATLVHDDVIDAAETRRGRPSSNMKWGNHTCVLAGDWLYMQAFQIALRERDFQILDLLISLTQMMVEGELLQLERIGKIGITEADCMELVDRKTACLFSVCARLGAICGGGDAQAREKLAYSPSFSRACASPPPQIAPSRAHTENRHAVLRSTSSMQSASVIPIFPMRSSCSSSPSTIIWVSEISRSRIWKSRSRSAIWNACIYSQSPASTQVWLPHFMLLDGRPRRVSAASITSSCTSVAAWIISTTAPRWIADAVVRPASFAEISSSAGRSRLPPLDCRYCPMAVTASTEATDSALIRRSTATRSS